MVQKSRLSNILFGFVIVLATFSYTKGNNITIDANITSQQTNTFPSLESAFTAMFSGEVAMDSTNYIIFLDSCVDVPQYFPDPSTVNSEDGQGSVLYFIYNDAPDQIATDNAITNRSVCSLLPTIVIANDSYVSFTNFSTVIFQGLTIHYNGAANQNTIKGTNTVNFNHFCINNSEPSGSLDSSFTKNFTFSSIDTFTMTDGIYIYDTLKTLALAGFTQATIDSMIFVNLDLYEFNTTANPSVPAISISSDQGYSMNATISNIQVTYADKDYHVCGTALSLFNISQVNAIQIYSVFLSSNCILGSFSTPHNMFGIAYASYLTIDSFSITNLILFSSFGGSVLDYMVYISAVENITISNVNLSNFKISAFGIPFSLFYIADDLSNPSSDYYPMSIYFQGWNIYESQLSEASTWINITFTTFQNFAGGSLQDFSVSLSMIEGSCSLLSLNTLDPVVCIFDAACSPQTFTINNFTVFETEIASSAAIFYFNYYNSFAIEDQELVFIEVSLVNSTSNVYETASLFEVVGMGMSIDSFVTKNDSLLNSAFYLNTETVDTLLVTNLNASSLSLINESALISANLVVARSSALIQDYFVEVDPNASMNINYAETRPFIIANSTFSIDSLSGESYLIQSTNPQVIISQNIISINTLSTSLVLQIGNYKLFNNPTTSYYPHNMFWGPYPSLYTPYTFVEFLIFENYPDFYQLYSNARDLLLSYDPVDDLSFFISVQQNTFENIITQNSNYPIIQVSAFDIPQSTVGIYNNTFFNISLENGSVSLTEYDTINRGIFVLNSLTESIVDGYFFSLQSNYLKNISFVQNSVSSTQELGLISISSSICENITIRDGVASTLQTNRTFINVECDSLSTQLLLSNCTFENITRIAAARTLLPVNFIEIINSQLNTSSQPMILFQDNSFDDIWLSNSQVAIHNAYVSSLIFILSFQAESQIVNTNLTSIITTSSAGMIMLSAPTITFINSKFQNLLFENINGAFDLTTSSLAIINCIFESNNGSLIDGAGLFKLTNADTSNSLLNVAISLCTFDQNVAPYGTIIYTTASFVNLSITDVELLNNLVTESGGLIHFFSGSELSISISNITVAQNASYLVTYPSLDTFYFDSTGIDAFLNIQDSVLTVVGDMNGTFIFITGALYPISLSLSNISYSIQEDATDEITVTQPRFGLFQGDNFVAQVSELNATNVLLNQTSLFVIECNSAGKTSYNWSLTIDQSVFSNLSLSEALIEISSDGALSGALNSASVLVQNTQFLNISWFASTATSASLNSNDNIGGIVKSLTSQIGRNLAPASTPNAYAVTLQNCTFINFTGEGSLIFNTVESVYDGILLINASSVSNLTSSSGGGVFNLSTTPLTSFVSTLTTYSSSSDTLRNNSLMISQNYFQNITAQQGCIINWQSALKGLAVTLQNNTLCNITCSQTGGVFYANYYGSDSLNLLIDNSETTLDHFFIIASENNTVKNISASNGGFMFLSGESQLFQVDLEQNTFQMMSVSGNGSIIYTSKSTSAGATPGSSTTTTRMLSSSQAQNMGNISLTDNQVSDIKASNGCIIYDTSSNNTLNFTVVSNSFDSIMALQRGGGFYITQPLLTVNNNSFIDVSAGFAGNLLYALSNQIDEEAVNWSLENNITGQSEDLIAFGPTNLLIELVSTADGSLLPLEGDNFPDYNPTVPNLTSYSLSEYLMYFTLVTQSSQVVYDESDDIQLTMYFISLRDATNTQKYVGTNCNNSICIVYTSDTILKGLAGDTILVNVTYQSAVYSQFQQFNITLRSCIAGEINQTDSQQCVYCKSGTYSLTPTVPTCNECPLVGASCYGGQNISITAGYYRSSSSSTTLNIFNCNDTDAPRCLGTQNNTCKKPFTGPGCLQCDESAGYISSGTAAKCDECHSESTLIIYATLYLIFTIAYQIFVTVTTFKENKHKHKKVQQDDDEAHNKAKPGQFITTFNTLNQLSSIFANMDVGTVVVSVLSILENAGNSNTKVIFSLRCLYRLVVPDDFSELRFQILLYIFSPLAKVLVCHVSRVY